MLSLSFLFFNILQIVLFPTLATLFLKYFDADMELWVSDTRNISSCNRFVFLDFAPTNSYVSANVLFVQSAFIQKNLRRSNNNNTFLPAIGKSCILRIFRECTATDSSPQYEHFTLFRIDFTYMIIVSALTSCFIYFILLSSWLIILTIAAKKVHEDRRESA